MVQKRIGQAIIQQGLDANFNKTVQHWYQPLAKDIASAAEVRGACLFLGVQGCQGSGKSTLASFVKIILEEQYELKVASISIDDFYLTRADREQLAASIHPLLRTRGVPGTHDLALAETTFTQLLALNEGNRLALPAFDKARDDRAPLQNWPEISGAIDVIIFEGWCVGVDPQTEEDIAQPINKLEANEDPHGIWRSYVNKQLAENYAALFARIHKLIVLNAPSFDCVYQWRALQEEKLAQKIRNEKLRNAHAQSPQELQRFISHYERLTRHCIQTMPTKADWLLPLNHEHEITDLIRKS